MFNADQIMFHQVLNIESRQERTIHDAEESKIFWIDTWDNPTEHNCKAE